MHPNLLIPGFPKCGTTSLHALLQSAGVAGTTTKEAGYLLRADVDEGNVAKAYHKAFINTADTNYRMDATPWYIFDQAVPAKFGQRDTPRTIILVREHHARLASMYRDQWSGRHERRTFDDAVMQSLSNIEFVTQFSHELPMMYASTSTYAAYIDRWIASPLGDDTRLLALENLVGESPAALTELSQWLGIDLPRSLAVANASADGYQASPAWLTRFSRSAKAVVPPPLRLGAIRLYQPIEAKIARMGVGGRSTDVTMDLRPEAQERLDELFTTDRAALRAVGEPVWLGGRPAWLTG